MIKLCVFDFDSTLMDGETITEFARSVGKEKEVADITRRAMRPIAIPTRIIMLVVLWPRVFENAYLNAVLNLNGQA